MVASSATWVYPKADFWSIDRRILNSSYIYCIKVNAKHNFLILDSSFNECLPDLVVNHYQWQIELISPSISNRYDVISLDILFFFDDDYQVSSCLRSKEGYTKSIGRFFGETTVTSAHEHGHFFVVTSYVVHKIAAFFI